MPDGSPPRRKRGWLIAKVVEGGRIEIRRPGAWPVRLSVGRTFQDTNGRVMVRLASPEGVVVTIPCGVAVEIAPGVTIVPRRGHRFAIQSGDKSWTHISGPERPEDPFHFL